MRTTDRIICIACLAAVGTGLPIALAGDDDYGPAGAGIETRRDLPGDATKYYGQRRNQFKDVSRRLAKTDLDADFNYDGVIDNDDPADNGAFQQTPPGLVVGVGELSQLILRIRPYRLDFKGRAVVSLQVDGINRGDKSGEFGSLDEEMANTGHIRVWRDPSRRTLILDSRDPARRVFEWAMDDVNYPANVPGIVPRTLYVEGVSPSGQFSGDVRLLLKVQHRKDGATTVHGGGAKRPKGVVYEEEPKRKRVLFKRFQTSYDHILLTVNSTPQRKEFVNNNSSGVWLKR